jgi:hypothetical protein
MRNKKLSSQKGFGLIAASIGAITVVIALATKTLDLPIIISSAVLILLGIALWLMG